MSEAAAFESALQRNPDDLATWDAYARYLVERGDPRGEFMQVQIALEDESRSKEDRDRLKTREAELLAAHERRWLGTFAPFVLDQESNFRDSRVRFTRGWLTELAADQFSVEMARALGRAPETQFLTRLFVRGVVCEFAAGDRKDPRFGVYEPGPDVPTGVRYTDAPAQYALRWCSRLVGVRVFCYGTGSVEPDGESERGGMWCNGSAVHDVIARMPHIEELYLYSFNANAGEVFALPMPHLRVLHLDHTTEYPLEVLAGNPTLGRLTHLLCRPHAQFGDPDAYIRLDHLRALCRSPHLTSLQHLRLMLTDFGDDGAEELVASGILKRLKVLDLSYGCIRDAGARRLAACPDLKNLSLLDLTMNALTPDGIAALQATGVPLKTDQQHGEHPDLIGDRGWLEYLSHGDIE